MLLNAKNVHEHDKVNVENLWSVFESSTGKKMLRPGKIPQDLEKDKPDPNS